MESPAVKRETISESLVAALQPLDYVHAMWEAGAAAFRRVDQWSDLDLMIDVDDGRVPDTFQILEETLASLGIIEVKYEIPQPAWHGHSQKFYRLQGANKFLLLDVTVIEHSNPNKFLQPEVHGDSVVLFDKTGVVQSPPLDWETFSANLKERIGILKVTFDLFQILPRKELNRQNDIEALAFFHGFVLRPLVEALRIRYAPARYNFHTRYIHYDLPPEVVAKLQDLFFVSNAEELDAKCQQASGWFYQTLAEIEKNQ